MPAIEFVRPRAYQSPPFLSTLLEATAPAEMLGFWGSRVVLQRLLPKGDGHPVLVIPAFMATDSSTVALRKLLDRLGYHTHAWGFGRNPGICETINRKVQERTLHLAEQSGKRVSLIGWSAGGLFARVVAHHQPKAVRQVITLGAPFGIDFGNRADGMIGRFQRLISSKERAPEPMIASGFIHRVPPVPSTSIISRRDGFSNWKYSLDVGDSHTENIIAPGSHSAMTHNPFVSALIADRLSQPEGDWKPFMPTALNRLFFRRVCARNEIPRELVREARRR